MPENKKATVAAAAAKRVPARAGCASSSPKLPHAAHGSRNTSAIMRHSKSVMRRSGMNHVPTQVTTRDPSRDRLPRLVFTADCTPRQNGGGGIRTHGQLALSTVFKTVPINHSGTPPEIASRFLTLPPRRGYRRRRKSARRRSPPARLRRWGANRLRQSHPRA